MKLEFNDCILAAWAAHFRPGLWELIDENGDYKELFIIHLLRNIHQSAEVLYVNAEFNLGFHWNYLRSGDGPIFFNHNHGKAVLSVCELFLKNDLAQIVVIDSAFSLLFPDDGDRVAFFRRLSALAAEHSTWVIVVNYKFKQGSYFDDEIMGFLEVRLFLSGIHFSGEDLLVAETLKNSSFSYPHLHLLNCGHSMDIRGLDAF
ncbi:MAG: hypothetical protein PHW04_15745 [Candidatus Wallbacteria bacterium]|nr:hypothetical protein [Candidatus Wallbacteria bacterium]